MENEVSRLKSCLFSDLYSLRELEISKQQTCRCRGFCGITHSKHNWVQSSSENIMTKLKTKFMKKNGSDKVVEAESETKPIHKCESCTKKFSESTDFIIHMQNNHQVAAVTFLD